MNEFIYKICITLIAYGADNLIMLMIFVFVIGIILKFLIFYLLKCEFNFSSAFETRTHRYLNKEYQFKKRNEFHEVVDFLLKKSFQESYISRKKQFRKRRGDPSIERLHKVFLIEDGALSLIEDTLKQTRYHDAEVVPDFKGISKYVFGSNPYFNKLWGVIPIGVTNSILNALPGLFIIGGIFGTFLGISKGLPVLKTIDPGDIVAAQETLKYFLESMTFAMYSSVVGIFLSVCFTILNAFLYFNATYINLVDKFTQSLELIWKDTNLSIKPLAQTL
ncbi:MAG: hypothetical protein GY797_37075 [Deltaproteobacteria bacterium]|nr:hypothetical protein [Deltaproteobacteria bacterium]